MIMENIQLETTKTLSDEGYQKPLPAERLEAVPAWGGASRP
jgi:hypothetical protein